MAFWLSARSSTPSPPCSVSSSPVFSLSCFASSCRVTRAGIGLRCRSARGIVVCPVRNL